MNQKTNALHNPAPEDLEKSHKRSEQEGVETPKDQLLLDLVPTRTSRWRQNLANLWARLLRRERELELMPFWRELAPAFTVTTGVLLTVGAFVAGIINFEKIPPQIPLYYNQLEQHWEQADKIYVLLIPVFIFVLEAVVVIGIYEVFYSDKRLAVMLSWILTTVNILSILAATQIYLLVT